MFAFLLFMGVGACGGVSDQAGYADGGQHASVVLENALVTAGDASECRITKSIGQRISVPFLGLDNDAPLDEDKPDGGR